MNPLPARRVTSFCSAGQLRCHSTMRRGWGMHITGTHWATTVAAMTGVDLRQAGCSPGPLWGGLLSVCILRLLRRSDEGPSGDPGPWACELMLGCQPRPILYSPDSSHSGFPRGSLATVEWGEGTACLLHPSSSGPGKMTSLFNSLPRHPGLCGPCGLHVSTSHCCFLSCLHISWGQDED